MRFFKETVVVFVSTALNFFFSFLLHFFLGRFLGPVDYGRLGVVLNLAWITGIPLGVVGVSLIKYSSVFNKRGEVGKLSFLLVSFLKFSFFLSVFFSLVYVLLSGFLSDFLGGGVSFLIVLLAFSLPFSGVSGVLLNFFQGVGLIFKYSFVNVVSSLLRLLFAVFLVLAGFGVSGALWSILLSGSCVILLCLPFVWRFFKFKCSSFSFSPVFKFGVSALFANFFINLVLYFDLFFVSSFLGSELAGFYNAAVTLSRAFLMSSAVMAVFFPEFSGDVAVSDFRKLRSSIKTALLYTGLICSGGLFIVWFFPELIISLTFSVSFLPAVPVLKVLSVGYSFFSLFNVMVYALWALNKHKMAGFFGISLFITDLVLLYFFVPAYGLLGAAWITTGLLGALFIFSLITVFKRFLKN